MSQVVVVATIRAREGQRDALLDAVRRLAQQTHAEAGCLAYAVHEDAQDQDVIVFIERWTSEVALENHRVQPHMKEFGRAARELLDGRAEIRVLRPVPAGDPVKGSL